MIRTRRAAFAQSGNRFSDRSCPRHGVFKVEVGMSVKTYLVGAALALLAGGMAGSAAAQEIKIGEINSYSLLPSFTEPYRKGWQLAVEEINAAGGISGKKLVVISKDDGGKPA